MLPPVRVNVPRIGKLKGPSLFEHNAKLQTTRHTLSISSLSLPEIEYNYSTSNRSNNYRK